MNYTIKELSKELGVNKKTCLRWIAEGLKIIDGSKKPILIMGSEAKKFLRNKDAKKKVKLKRKGQDMELAITIGRRPKPQARAE